MLNSLTLFLLIDKIISLSLSLSHFFHFHHAVNLSSLFRDSKSPPLTVSAASTASATPEHMTAIDRLDRKRSRSTANTTDEKWQTPTLFSSSSSYNPFKYRRGAIYRIPTILYGSVSPLSLSPLAPTTTIIHNDNSTTFNNYGHVCNAQCQINSSQCSKSNESVQ